VWDFLQAADITEIFTAGKLESASASFQAHKSNTSTEVNIIWEKTMQITAHLRVDNFTGCNGWINRFKKRCNIFHRTLASEGRRVHSETVDDWKNDKLLQKNYEKCMCCLYTTSFTHFVHIPVYIFSVSVYVQCGHHFVK
jgi:hypothetical protein